MAPTLAATPLFVTSGAVNSSAITTASFTPSNGEVVVVKMTTGDTTVSMGAPTGGSQTYTSRVVVAPGGFNGWCAIYTAVISGSPGSMTISATPSGSTRHSLLIERWNTAQLAATPATGSASGTAAAANTTLTSTASNSIVSWVAVDEQSIDPATRTYLSSATEDGLDDAHASADAVHYYAYQSAAAAGSQSFGLSAPTGMKYVIAGIEILDASGGGGGFLAPPPLVIAQAVNRSNTY
jgi:hypothetical protein